MITLRLTAHPIIDEQPPVAEEPTEQPLPAAAAETRTGGQPMAEPEVAEVPAEADAPSEAGSARGNESMEQTDGMQAAALRATLLDQIRSLPAESEAEGQGTLPWTASGESIPGLPGMRGWISGHVGSVAPSAQTWKENDGSSRGRYVLADGTIVCTRRRAPTIDEMMNPWKSIAVTMSSLCGRQRAELVDYGDPRVQPPPSTGTK